jgi:threonine dehydratase
MSSVKKSVISEQLTAAAIREAHDRIKDKIIRTPLMTSSSIDEMVGAIGYFKCENLQKIGAFKARGATNAVFSLTDEEAACGVATHSSGNHAAAVA